MEMPMTRHMYRSLFFVLPVVLLLIAALLVRPTHSSYATSASITLSLTYGPPTSSVQVKGSGFKGSETVSLLFDSSQLKSVAASKTGTFSVTIIIPSSALPGNHLLQAKGKSSGSTAQKPFLVQTDWVQQGFNREHTGFNVFENVLTTGNVGHLTQSWVYPIDTNNYSAYVMGGGAIVNSIVYVSCYNNAYAFCALTTTTGQLLWSYPTGNSTASTPAVANGFVYFGSTDGKLYALNAATGTFMWSYDTGFVINNAPLTANGLVYIGASNDTLSALNSLTGQIVWKHSFPGGLSTPSIDGGLLYLSAGGNLYALKSQTGQLMWHVSAKGGTPIIAGGMIYVNDRTDSKLLALNEQTGALVWSNAYSSLYASASDPSVANGVVYLTIPTDCNLQALSGATGSLLWQYNTIDQAMCLEGAPIVANGIVFVGSSDARFAPTCFCSDVYELSATTGTPVGGQEDGFSDGGLNSNNPIIVVNGTLYYFESGTVQAYRLPS